MNAMAKGVQVVVRVEQTTVDLADEVAELIGKTSPIKPTRTAVLRAAIERGLADMKGEISSGSKRRK
jgi:hypothetical protein